MGTLGDRPIRLSRNDAREAARLLRHLQIHLASAIETTLAPGEIEPRDAADAYGVYKDRVKIKSAERLIRNIDIALGDRKRARTVSRKSPDSAKRRKEQN